MRTLVAVPESWTTLRGNTFLSLSGLSAELAEIDENIVRNELTTLERSEQLARRKEVYEAIHPKTQHGGDRKSEKSRRNDFALNSFAMDTATKTDVSPRTVQQEVQIASKISGPAKEMIRDTPVADDKTSLLEIARMPPGWHPR
jgi:ParB family transcriptional regulator, chromosome partitioning protein